MSWIKHVIIDLAVSLLIVLATTLDLPWARWIVLIYTPFMLILKIVVFLGSRSLSPLKPQGDAVPRWFYHLLYAINVLFSAFGAYSTQETTAHHWWMIAGGWTLIWVLSIVIEVRMRPARAQ